MYVYEISVMPIKPSVQARTTYVVADRAADVRAWISGTMLTKREDREAPKWHASENSWRRKTKTARYYIRKVHAAELGKSQIGMTAVHCPSTRKGAAR